MDIFDLLTMIGGLCLFLFGMNVMGQALERRAGNSLRGLLEKMTTNRAAGLLTGLGITAVIQSSSATTVMVVGFVNSGLMTLKQAINVIMGANIGTTVTAWVLSLAGIDSANLFVRLLKPSSFTPILALIGIIFFMFCKNTKKRDTGAILLGFATLMSGMQTMSDAASGLSGIPAFRELFLLFQNPVLGALAGAILTAILQSSSASIGILQALAATGQVSYRAAIPIVMGQNIGTCLTAMLSAIGTTKNAKRAAMVHLAFNVTGTAALLTVFCIIKRLFSPALLHAPASSLGIAAAHSAFNVLCTLLMLPLAGLLEKLVCQLIPDSAGTEKKSELDERLLAAPPIALERCRMVASKMAVCAANGFKDSLSVIETYSPGLVEGIFAAEEQTDHYEDILGTYLVRLSALPISSADSREAARLLKSIGDFERISDHAASIAASAKELQEKNCSLSSSAQAELAVLSRATGEILDLALSAFLQNDATPAERIEPLSQVIDRLKETMRTRHILRLQKNQCSIETGFILSDLLTDLSRVSDHCSNIAGCIIDMAAGNLNLHESLRAVKRDSETYAALFAHFSAKYQLP